jgi:hypothetical protein
MGRKMETEMEPKSKMEMERREMDGEQQFVAPIKHVSVYEVRVGSVSGWITGGFFSLLRVETPHRKANAHAMQ